MTDRSMSNARFASSLDCSSLRSGLLKIITAPRPLRRQVLTYDTKCTTQNAGSDIGWRLIISGIGAITARLARLG